MDKKIRVDDTSWERVDEDQFADMFSLEDLGELDEKGENLKGEDQRTLPPEPSYLYSSSRSMGKNSDDSLFELEDDASS